jgi:enoyl-[acyl-carrier protein] reductase I
MANNLLKGKRGIIFGALDENSIAWKTALKVKEEGGSFTLTNAPIAMRMGKILGGKLDFVLHSIGMSPNVRKGRPYGDMNYEWFLKTLDISGVSFHKVLQTAEKLDSMNEWGSILALTYIAAQRTYPDYSDMAQAKAVLESIARSYGYRFGKLKKVRVNTISQSPTKTTAGAGISGFDVFFDYAQMMSPLGNASSEDCASYIVSMFSDFTRMVTMQNLMHDGGFSSTGITEDLIQRLTK